MEWCVFSLMLPYLKPAGFEYFCPVLDLIFDIGRVISALTIVLLYILRKKRPSKLVWIIAMMYGWIVFSTFLNDGKVWDSFLMMASTVSVVLIIEYWALRPFVLLSGVLRCFELMLYTNFISVVIFYPKGLYIVHDTVQYNDTRCYFLGYHNVFILYVLPAIVVGLLYRFVTTRKTRANLLMIVGVESICITWSATSICGLFVFVLILLMYRGIGKQWINYHVIFIATMIVNLLISVIRIMDRVQFVAYLVVRALKKQVSLTGRTFIWDSFYSYFSRSPWLGYGMGADVRASSGFYAPHMHNQWFQYLFEAGIPALILFLLLNFIVGAQLDRYRDERTVSIFMAAFAAMYVLFIAEAYSSPLFFMIFPLAYHINQFEIISTPRRVRFVWRKK